MAFLILVLTTTAQSQYYGIPAVGFGYGEYHFLPFSSISHEVKVSIPSSLIQKPSGYIWIGPFPPMRCFLIMSTSHIFPSHCSSVMNDCGDVTYVQGVTHFFSQDTGVCMTSLPLNTSDKQWVPFYRFYPFDFIVKCPYVCNVYGPTYFVTTDFRYVFFPHFLSTHYHYLDDKPGYPTDLIRVEKDSVFFLKETDAGAQLSRMYAVSGLQEMLETFPLVFSVSQATYNKYSKRLLSEVDCVAQYNASHCILESIPRGGNELSEYRSRSLSNYSIVVPLRHIHTSTFPLFYILSSIIDYMLSLLVPIITKLIESILEVVLFFINKYSLFYPIVIFFTVAGFSNIYLGILSVILFMYFHI